jgi:hypothetical protein
VDVIQPEALSVFLYLNGGIAHSGMLLFACVFRLAVVCHIMIA